MYKLNNPKFEIGDIITGKFETKDFGLNHKQVSLINERIIYRYWFKQWKYGITSDNIAGFATRYSFLNLQCLQKQLDFFYFSPETVDRYHVVLTEEELLNKTLSNLIDNANEDVGGFSLL